MPKIIQLINGRTYHIQIQAPQFMLLPVPLQSHGEKPKFADSGPQNLGKISKDRNDMIVERCISSYTLLYLKKLAIQMFISFHWNVNPWGGMGI